MTKMEDFHSFFSK